MLVSGTAPDEHGKGRDMQRWQRGSAALLSLALVVSACAGAGTDDEVDPTADAAEDTGENGDNGAGDGDVTNITIAAVNNPQMEDMRELTNFFHDEHPNVRVEWVILPENQLRDRVTQDIATEGGQFDVMTIGTYEAPIWAENGWLTGLTDYAQSDEDYDVEDVIEPIRTALSFEDQLYAVPFYGESSFLMYRTDLFEEAGLEMPERPTWEEVDGFARELHDPGNDMYGICLRGLPGWGEVFAPLNTVVNTFGGRWYDMEWNAQLTEEPFVEAVEFYVDLVREAGQPGAANSGFTECLTTYGQGNAAMWYDATSAAGSVENPEASTVVGQSGYVFAPVKETDASGWLWAWALAIPETSQSQDAAWEFVNWATSKEYIRLVGEELGWERVPPGSRVSTYEIPEYQEAAEAFATITVDAINEAEVENPGTEETPYVGVQYVGIPEFQDLGTRVSQEIAAAIAGNQSVADALETGQQLAEDVAERGGYR
jgi:sorbitol/mannitol transport system substrate-binding protein